MTKTDLRPHESEMLSRIENSRSQPVSSIAHSAENESEGIPSIEASMRSSPRRIGSDGKLLLSVSWLIAFVFCAGFIVSTLAWRGTVQEKEKLQDDVRATIRGFIGAAEAQTATGNYSEAADIIEGIAEINASMPGGDVSDEINADLITARRRELTRDLLIASHYDPVAVDEAVAILHAKNNED